MNNIYVDREISELQSTQQLSKKGKHVAMTEILDTLEPSSPIGKNVNTQACAYYHAKICP